MYQCFTDRARKVVQLANEASHRFNHEYIGPEHILLALIEEGSGVAANVLKNLDVDLGKVRLDIEKVMQTGEYPPPKGELPQTPGAKKVVEYAMEEAVSLHHNYVGSEHILLGLLREQESLAAQVLHDRGVTLEEARAEVLSLLGHGIEKPRDHTADTDHPPTSGYETNQPRDNTTTTEHPPTSGTPAMFEQFTARAREVMKLARQESERLHGEYIGTEHFLLGLIKEGNGEAAKVLQSLHVDTDNLRTEVEKLVESGPGTVTKGRLSLTPQAINVVQYAMKEAHHLNHNYVGAEHILTGLLCEREGVAAQVLNNRGVTLEGVRASILSLLGPSTFDRTQGDGGEGMGKSEESAAEPPAVCSACGYPRIVRVLWNWVHLWGKMAEDVRSGKAILGSRYGGAGPPWVCLQCVPEWSEVHRLATLEWQWLLAKEEALNSREFEKAELCRDAQDEVRQRLSCVVEELSKTQRNPST